MARKPIFHEESERVLATAMSDVNIASGIIEEAVRSLADKGYKMREIENILYGEVTIHCLSRIR